MEFDWDEGNIEKNLVKHNVHDWEIESAFLDSDGLVSVERIGVGEDRRALLARVEESGRYLHVVFTVRMKAGRICYLPISARDMELAERRRYRKS